MRSLEPGLALLQLTDSMFPSGAFTHSYGLEQLARDRHLQTPADLDGFVRSVLHGVFATADAPSCFRAGFAAHAGDLDAVIDADRALFRSKAAEELRNASTGVGRRLLEETAPYVDDPLLHRYRDRLRDDRTLGTQPVAFGVISAVLGVDAASSTSALLLNAVTGLLQASMRLLPVSHRDVQALLHALRPEIAAIVARLENEMALPLRAFQPLQEIASMRHAMATARQFAS